MFSDSKVVSSSRVKMSMQIGILALQNETTMLHCNVRHKSPSDKIPQSKKNGDLNFTIAKA